MMMTMLVQGVPRTTCEEETRAIFMLEEQHGHPKRKKFSDAVLLLPPFPLFLFVGVRFGHLSASHRRDRSDNPEP
jgi:hypothetical protein